MAFKSASRNLKGIFETCKRLGTVCWISIDSIVEAGEFECDDDEHVLFVNFNCWVSVDIYKLFKSSCWFLFTSTF